MRTIGQLLFAAVTVMSLSGFNLKHSVRIGSGKSLADTTVSLPMDSSAFDFWVGTWKATWTAAGQTFEGKNEITVIMNGKILQERFEILTGPSKGFVGGSYSVLDKRTGQWRQTWVDSQGAYMDFTGRADYKGKYFERTITDAQGHPVVQRMVFYNITSGSFDWDWEASTDNSTWKLLWRIHYSRIQ